MTLDSRPQTWEFKLNKMSIGANDNRFYFTFKHGHAPLRNFRFISYETDGVVTSTPQQDLVSTLTGGASWALNIPVRENDATLRTIVNVPITWATKQYPMRLTLRGLIQFEWDITFEIEMFPFNLSGSWREI